MQIYFFFNLGRVLCFIYFILYSLIGGFFLFFIYQFMILDSTVNLEHAIEDVM